MKKLVAENAITILNNKDKEFFPLTALHTEKELFM